VREQSLAVRALANAIGGATLTFQVARTAEARRRIVLCVNERNFAAIEYGRAQTLPLPLSNVAA